MMPFNVSLKCVVKRRMEMWRIVLMMLTSLVHVSETAYCTTWCYSPSCMIVNACTENQATAPAIYIDSSVAPINSNKTCLCLLTHSLSLEDNEFFVQSHSNKGGGMQFEIDDATFNTTSDMTTLTLSTDTHIKYSQSGDTFHSKLCLGISTGFNGSDITINCYTSDTIQALTTSNSIERPSKDPHTINGLSSIGTHTTSYETTAKSVTENKQIQIGTIAGSAGGGAVLLLIIAALVIFLACRRKHKDKSELEGSGSKPASDESDYYMKTNANYISADSLSPVSAYVTSNQHESDEYADIDKSVKRKENIVVESDYNHLNDVQAAHVTGNIYNTFEADTYNISRNPREGNETNVSDYDTMKKY